MSPPSGSVLKKHADGVYRVEPWARYPWLEHGFGTRQAAGWPEAGRLVTIKQVHSAICLHATGAPGLLGEGDGLLTATPGILLSVRTADCLPLLLADPVHRAVAAVHAGWRGAAKAIALEAVRKMRELFGARPEDLTVAFGPAIGPCCYEVGPEVAGCFQALFPERDDLGARTLLNLGEACRRQLLEAGIPAERMYGDAPCTCCHSGEFHSYRRDGARAGRMLSVVGIRV